MRSLSLVAVAAFSQPLFFTGFAVAKPAPRAGARDTKYHFNGVGRYHRPPMRPVKIVIVEDGPATKTDVPQVVVYVDQEGYPIETVTKSVQIASSPTPTPHVVVEPAEVVNSIPSDEFTPLSLAVEPPPPAIPRASASKDTTPEPASPRNDTSVLLSGVTYSPYNPDGTCKAAQQVTTDFQALAPLYSLIRIYGVDCDQVTSVLTAAASLPSSSTPLRLFLGIFNIDSLSTELSTLIQAVTASPSQWSLIDTISIGNELVNNGQASAAQVLSAVTSARNTLRGAGYTGPVVTVDTFIAVTANPSLCDLSDYCAMNIHPFFDSNTTPDQAGNFVLRQIANVREVLADPTQRIVVTESGWPWQGNANGAAVPGVENQEIAVASIMERVGDEEGGGIGLGNLILFTAFNDPWKKAEPGTFYAEPFWGMHSD